MKFIVKTTTGAEVIQAGPPHPSAPVYYGGPPPETGRWRVDIVAFEEYCARRLAQIDFGPSIETYVFGLEIAELDAWGDTFTATGNYTSYRPKMKALVSVGQIEWSAVKHQPFPAQVAALWSALIASIDRVTTMKHRPRNFDPEGFATAVRLLMASSDADMFAFDGE